MSKRGPFGLWMGMRESEISFPLEEVGPGKFTTYTVPKPHSAFESYVLQITPRNGLAWVKALGHTIQTNSFGTQLVAEFEHIRSKLASSYGPHQKLDFLYVGSIWDEPRDWMSALEAKERVLMAMWNAEENSNLPEDIESVGIGAYALDASSGYIAVEYSFSNAEGADAEIACLEDEVL